MTITTRRILIIVFAAVLAGCAREAAPPRPAPPGPVTPTVAVPSAADYFRQQTSRSLFVVRAAELALARSTGGKAASLASRLKFDHTGIAAQFSMAGRRLNLLPSATLPPGEQAMLDAMAAAPAFDATFLQTMEGVIDQCRRANARYADAGDSATLRPVARFAAATCGDELRLF